MGCILVRFRAPAETGRMITNKVEGGDAETVDSISLKYRGGVEINVAASAAPPNFELTCR